MLRVDVLFSTSPRSIRVCRMRRPNGDAGALNGRDTLFIAFGGGTLGSGLSGSWIVVQGEPRGRKPVDSMCNQDRFALAEYNCKLPILKGPSTVFYIT